VLAAPGDRRDEDIRDIAKIGGKAFDRLILRRDDDLRGRQPEEVPRMLEKTLLEEGYPKEHMQVIPDEQEAIGAALSMARRGDLLLVFADAISRSWKQIIYYKSEGDEARSRRPASNPPPPKDPSSPSVSRLRAQEAFSGETVIQDERGVRLARETDD
jgi:cyanophycin synthetase